MSCCLSNRPALDAGLSRPTLAVRPVALASPGDGARGPTVRFQLRQGPPLLLHGRVSARHYHFRHPGDTVAVDPRDAAQLAAHPALRRG